jgi:hypothetical protein
VLYHLPLSALRKYRAARVTQTRSHFLSILYLQASSGISEVCHQFDLHATVWCIRILKPKILLPLQSGGLQVEKVKSFGFTLVGSIELREAMHVIVIRLLVAYYVVFIVSVTSQSMQRTADGSGSCRTALDTWLGWRWAGPTRHSMHSVGRGDTVYRCVIVSERCPRAD